VFELSSDKHQFRVRLANHSINTYINGIETDSNIICVDKELSYLFLVLIKKNMSPLLYNLLL